MRSAPTILALAACLALGACGDAPRLDPSIRPELPPIPADLDACLHRAFPEIPSRAFGRREAVQLIADAKLLDRAKTACGDRALHWMTDVVKAFGRPTS
ncbi:hypothetical protein B2G69_07800 [Methylorubrum zatmanii]|nr:hypothetical protein [Methylorubrum zatmanii]ARO54058.1 hypothetical protein B2G69_07800 [Methylorubrum zatmanii]